jgi:hypothetical protein
LLPPFRRPVKLGPDVGWKGEGDVKVQRVGRDVVHDGDEVAGHRLHLAQRACLRSAADLGHADTPDRAVPIHFSMVDLQLRHPKGFGRSRTAAAEKARLAHRAARPGRLLLSLTADVAMVRLGSAADVVEVGASSSRWLRMRLPPTISTRNGQATTP